MLRLHAASSSCTQHVMLRLHAAASSCTRHVMLRLHAASSSCTQHVMLRLHAAASSCTQHVMLRFCGGVGGVGGGVSTFLFLRFCGSFSATTSSSFMILPLVQICFYLLIMPLGFRNSRYCDSIQSKLADCFKGSISISTLVYILRFFSCFWMPVDFD